MTKRDDDSSKLYSAWRAAEARYAALLAEFGDEPPAKISKDTAVALVKARAKVNQTADKYFKKALK